MNTEYYDRYLTEIHLAQSELEKQAECITSQAEQERRRIDLYLSEKEREYDKKYHEKLFKLSQKENAIEEQYALKTNELEKSVDTEKQKLNELKIALEKIAEERQIGFPWIAERIANARDIICKNSYQYSNAYKYRESLREIERLKGLIDFHEYLYPHLKELHVKIEDTNAEENALYTEEEKNDEAHFWLTPEEYREKSEEERNQLALKRYKKKHLSNWEIGKLYENYIGFTYEQKGYKVNYNGIKERVEDKGRDLICENDEEILLIQCKNWNSSKTIFEKHIFQFYGSICQYRFEQQKNSSELFLKKVRGIFYTTTKLSEFARHAAKELDIELVENDNMDKDYPCIKCNCGKNGERIYHLPFDQQYDVTKISPEHGEFYAHTCKEAESRGFRRAFKWYGQ